MVKITALDTFDVRFPTSLDHDGSDAMNPDPDYSAAYVVLRTDSPDGLSGYGLVFTIGRGNDVQTAALAALEHMVVGRPIEDIVDRLGDFARELNGDSQLRWLGPEKGVMHMAIGAVINAAWDLASRRAGKPLWRFIADMTPEQLVAQIDFRYLTDALTPAQALAILREAEPHKQARIAQLETEGYPAYTTSPGWLGYSDEKDAATRATGRAGWLPHHQAQGRPSRGGRYTPLPAGTCRRGPDIAIAVDANQRWDVDTAIEWLETTGERGPRLGGGTDQPRRRARSCRHPSRRRAHAHLHRRTRAEPRDVQAVPAGGRGRPDPDRCRARRRREREPRHPAAGGAFRCPRLPARRWRRPVRTRAAPGHGPTSWRSRARRKTAPSSTWTTCTSTSSIRVRIEHGRYMAPTAPGFSAQMHPDSVTDHLFPDGLVWRELSLTVDG